MLPRMLVGLCLVAAVHCATWMGRQPHKPRELAHKKGCYIKEIEDVIPFGKSVSVAGECYSVECSRHSIYYADCGIVGTEDPQCYVTPPDPRRPYPDCCPSVKCETDNYIA